MLRERDAVATIAVKDVSAAREFYGGKLGLSEAPTGQEGVLSFRSGASTILVYRSTFAGTNQATAATWFVGPDVEAVARDLASRGVRFERYSFPGATMNGDVHVMGDVKAAWFKDPDGNILSIVNG